MNTAHHTSSTRSYTLSELRDGTGWPAGARFAQVPSEPTPDPETVAFIAIGAAQAWTDKGGEADADVFGGFMHYVNECTRWAVPLDEAFAPLIERSAMTAVFVYEVAEAFGHQYGTELIAEGKPRDDDAARRIIVSLFDEQAPLLAGNTEHDAVTFSLKPRIRCTAAEVTPEQTALPVSLSLTSRQWVERARDTLQMMNRKAENDIVLDAIDDLSNALERMDHDRKQAPLPAGNPGEQTTPDADRGHQLDTLTAERDAYKLASEQRDALNSTLREKLTAARAARDSFIAKVHDKDKQLEEARALRCELTALLGISENAKAELIINNVRTIMRLHRDAVERLDRVDKALRV